MNEKKPDAQKPEPQPEPQAKPAAQKIEAVAALPAMLDDAPESAIVPTVGIAALFTKVIFAPVSGDTYARERERRNKGAITVGYSRKVADVQIQLAGTGIYTPGTISIVQGVSEKFGHLEMSIGVWNPETRKTSFLCADSVTKEQLQAWKEATCTAFNEHCKEHGIDLNTPATAAQHRNAVAVNLLPTAPTA